MEINVIKRRVTAFVGNYIGCTADNIGKLAAAFPAAYVIAGRQGAVLQPIKDAKGNERTRRWAVKDKKGNGGYSISFGFAEDGRGRVDMETRVLIEEGKDETERMTETLGKALGALGIDVIWRMAYNPLTAVVDSDTFNTDDLFLRRLSMAMVDGKAPTIQEMRALYVLEKRFAGKRAMVNIACNLCKGTRTDRQTGGQTPCTMFNVDMSTQAEENGKYGIDDIKAFAKEAAVWKREIIEAMIL